jgi:hypothetical protein
MREKPSPFIPGTGIRKSMQFICLAAIAILIVVFSTGCTGGETQVPAGETLSATPGVTQAAVGQTATVPPAATPAVCAYPPLNPWTRVPESYTRPGTVKIPPEPGSSVSRADLFGTPSLRWDEYEFSQQIRSLPDSYGTSRVEKTVEKYRGQSAVHENHTYYLQIPGEPAASWDYTIDDMYYDEYGNMLAMHRRVIRDGEYLEDADRSPVDMKRGTPDCSGEVFSPRYTYIGIDPVTVPAGSYPAAMKYVSDADDAALSTTATVTSWFAEGVPVSVRWRIEDPEKGLYFTYELKGWG